MDVLISLGIAVIITALIYFWAQAKNRKHVKATVNGMTQLGFIACAIDGEIDEYELLRLKIRIKHHIENEAASGKYTKFYKEFLDEDGDFGGEAANTLADDAIRELDAENLGFNDQHIDEKVYAVIDRCSKSILRFYRKYTFETIVEICSADVEFHTNEELLIDHVGKSLKIKKKEQKRIIEQEKALVQQAIANVEAEEAKKALWDQRIKQVDIPGWKQEMEDFMALLYDKDLEILLETPDKKVAKDVRGLTEAGANVLKKQVSS